MNIREVEEATGLVRANIRYYEQEGFFTSERESNGYRNYTDENVRVLKRIKLLRMLQVPIEEIRQIQSDEVLMRTVLERSIRRAEEKKRELDSAQQICKRMNEDRVTWNTLDADRYLRQFGKVEEEDAKKEFSVSDYQVYKPHNIRRYVARMIDLELYALVVHLIYYLVLAPGVHLNALNGSLLSIFSFLLMYLVEPVFLHFLGTTPGKWIMGIRLHYFTGRKLTVGEARTRTWRVLLWGYGLGIPVFNLVRLIKSAWDNSDCKALPWDEYGSQELEVEELENWKHWVLRVGGCVLAFVLLVGAQIVLQLDAQYPVNRGSLTKAELVENINTYLDEVGIYSHYDLGEDLQWKEISTPGTVYIEIGTTVKPQLKLVETDGVITEVSFQQTLTEDGLVSSYDGLIRVLMLAYGGAQPEVNLWNRNLSTMLNLIKENVQEGFSEQIGGIELSYKIENSGYLYTGEGVFIGEEGKDHRLTISFSMTLTE